MTQQSPLCDPLYKCIQTSNHIEFNWGKDKTLISHTSIVLKFDGNARYTIDFGPTSERQSGKFGSFPVSSKRISALSLVVGSDVCVNGFNSSKTKLMGQLLEFSISSDVGKNLAIDLLLQLSQIKMGDYRLLKNNCRDFVEIAMDTITANKTTYKQGTSSSGNRNQKELQKLRKKDKTKLATAGAVVLGIAGIGASKAFGSN